MLAIGGRVGHARVMRGASERQLAVLSSLRPEDLIPADHPIPRSTVAPPAIAAIS